MFAAPIILALLLVGASSNVASGANDSGVHSSNESALVAALNVPVREQLTRAQAQVDIMTIQQDSGGSQLKGQPTVTFETAPFIARSLTETAPTPAPCADDDDAASSASGGYNCATLAAYGQCSSLFCPSCDYAGYCDASCGYCPTPEPTPAPCADDDDAASSASGGYDCATLAAYGQCASLFCSSCDYAGYCDASCGYCPTPEPTPAPCADDDDAASSASGGYDCTTLAAYGQCSALFCPTCDYAGYCDVSCDYCSPAAGGPTFAPSYSPTTVNPTASVSPTSSNAPTLAGNYDVSDFTEFSNAIDTAMDDRPWVLTVTNDISIERALTILPRKHIKVIGSSALGRRALIAPSTNNTDDDEGWWGFFKNVECTSCYRTSDFTLWLENLDISGFGVEGEDFSAIAIGSNASVTVLNCRFAQNQGAAILLEGSNNQVIVRGSEFADNMEGNSGAGIMVGVPGETGNIVEVVDTEFARNYARGVGAAIAAFQGNTITIRSCTFFDNLVEDYGGAVGMLGDVENLQIMTILDSQFRNNTAPYAGAVFSGVNMQLVISNTTFADNIAHGTGAGALWTSSDSKVLIASSRFDRNNAPGGAGGALMAVGGHIDLTASNFSENMAATDGGAIRSERSASLYIRGAMQFVGNIAKKRGGAISLDQSLLKTNEGALAFAKNEAMIGGAMSVDHGASVLISPGCQTVTFEMNWASSSALTTASLVVRRVEGTSLAPSPVAASCADDDTAASVASGGYDCATLSAHGYCSSMFCPTCDYAGSCDASCDYCPTPAPTQASCADDDTAASAASGGYDCAALSAYGYCSSMFCPTCDYAGSCDASCNYCATPAPTQASCADDDTAASAASGGYDCATLSTYGYCSSMFCPTCDYAGSCDASCDYCSTQDGDSVATPTAAPFAASPVVLEDMVDERGDWTVLLPSSQEDSSVSFCLAEGDYEIIGSEGSFCLFGWDGGYVRVVDLAGVELLSGFTITAGCTKTTSMKIAHDASLTSYEGSVLFEGNHATGESQELCGTGCGGALYVGDSSTADLDRVELHNNSASDGGALFVDQLAKVSLSRGMMRHNVATGNGGGLSAATTAVVKVVKTTVRQNAAGKSGGALHVSGVAEAIFQDIDATDNMATNGGAIAARDTTRTAVKLDNSTMCHNKAHHSGGGLSLEDSAMDVTGVQFLENSAGTGHGGAVAASGADTLLDLSDATCVNVDVLLDWTSTGDGCQQALFGFYTCELFTTVLGATCAELEADYGSGSCNGCPCNDGYVICDARHGSPFSILHLI